MEKDMNELEIMADLIASVHDIYLWTYDADGKFLATSCSDSDIQNELIDETHLQTIVEESHLYSKPSIIPGLYHVFWIVGKEKNNDILEKIHVLGPFFMDSYPESTINRELNELNPGLEKKYQIFDLLKKVPAISFLRIMEYAIIMHYAITKEKIGTYDLHYSKAEPTEEEKHFDVDTKVHGTYEMEQEMLRMVREGDLRLTSYLSKLSKNVIVGKLANDDSEPLRQFKNTVLVSIVLFSRAAIEGGLYPDTAMTLTDMYFQSIEAAESFQQIADIAYTMEQDFVNRVHKIRTNRYSKPIATMIDYIDLHLEDDIFIRNISAELGYSDYYLTKLFKKETGSSFKEYLRDKRLERSVSLLNDYNLSVSDVADRLKFSSTSYFIDSYKKKFGVTPGRSANGQTKK